MSNPPPPPEYIFREHKSTINYVHMFEQDQYFASCDSDGWIVIWRLKTRRPIHKWKAHEDSCLKVLTIGVDRIISQGRDNMIHVWKFSVENSQAPELTSSVVYNALGFCKFSCYQQTQGSTLLCFPSKDDINMFDIYDLTYQHYVLQNIGADGRTDNGLLRHGACMAVQLFGSLDTLFVVAGYESGGIVLWQIEQDQAKCVWHKKEHKEPVLDLAVDVSKTFILSSSADNQVYKYSVQTGDIINKITIKKSGMVALRIRSDNKVFALGGYDGKIRLFSVKTMKPLAILSYHKNTTYGLDFGTVNYHWLISASQDHRIGLWNIF
ncbi:WD40-repeat-containing domain protein [Choanephora cucurbitarum]|nr:WD40-repeat-containing domain protein [Choanephora cucurbitarum]